MSWILPSNSPFDLFLKEGGGKALNLARMTAQALPVPAWFCVSAEAFDLFISRNGLEALLASAKAEPAWEELVRNAFLIAEVPQEVLAELQAMLESSGLAGIKVAVRSSGLEEDGAAHSFAGQFSSFLYQQGLEQITDSLRLCWASAYSQRVIAYRQEKGLSGQRLRMGVVVQKMVDAEAAGVAFSRHPIKILDRDLIHISSVWGAGEGLVSGLLDADDFEYRRSDDSIKSVVAKKTKALVAKPEGGLVEVEIGTARQDQPSLSDAQIKAIAALAIRLEQLQNCPQDLEWVVEGHNIYLVQTRPITSLPPEAYYDPKINGIEPILWDNSNIIESYSGVTTPLTFSFASRAYNQVYIQFLEVMGVPQDFVDKRSEMFRNMLGLVRGRIYYNLANWYELVLALPGTSSNKGFMDTMMGVKQGLAPQMQAIFDNIKEPPQYTFGAKLLLLVKTVYRFLCIDSIIGGFFQHYNAVYDEARVRDLKAMSLPEQLKYYFYLEDNFTKRWHAPIINDYLCMIFFGLLKKLTGKWIGQGLITESLQNDLLCGEGGLDSTEPTRFLMRMARDIDHGSDEVRKWFLSTPVPDLVIALRGSERQSKLGQEFARFLELYGFRCVNELKLEEPDLHDDPSFLIHSLQSYVKSGSYNTASMEEREKAIRHAAEEKVKTHLKGWRRMFYWFILRQARKAVKNRENLRFARTKSFGISRHLFRAMGSHLTQLGLLAGEHDIFYLTFEEISAFIEGRVIGTNLKALVAMRREEFDIYRRTPSPPERFVSTGAAGVSSAFPAVLMEADLLRDLQAEAELDPTKLRGTPCCPGVIEGRVRVVHELKDAEGIEGEILVTARTDPGWVPIFPSCKGLLIERGSLLSHSAVVARELGLPTIVGINGGLMNRLKSGDLVRVDAGLGEVTILESAGVQHG